MNINSRSYKILMRSLYQERPIHESGPNLEVQQTDHRSVIADRENEAEADPSILDLSISELVPWQDQQEILECSMGNGNYQYQYFDLDTGVINDTARKSAIGMKKVDIGRGDSGHNDVVRGENGHNDVVRGENGHNGVVRGENGHNGVVRGENGHNDLVRGENGRDDMVRGENGRDDVVRGENGRDDAVRGENIHNDVVGGEHGRDDVVKGENDHNDVVRGENGHNNMVRDENGHNDMVRGENGHNDMVRGENGRNDVVRGENCRDHVVRGESGRNDVGRGESGGDDVVSDVSIRDDFVGGMSCRDDVVIGENVRNDLGRGDSNGDDVVRRDIVGVDVGRGDSGGNDVGSGDSGGVDVVRGDSGGVDVIRGDSGVVDVVRGDSGGVDVVRGDSGGVGLVRGDSDGDDVVRGESSGDNMVRDDSGCDDVVRWDVVGVDVGRGDSGGDDVSRGDSGGDDVVRGDSGGDNVVRDVSCRDDVGRGESVGSFLGRGDCGVDDNSRVDRGRGGVGSGHRGDDNVDRGEGGAGTSAGNDGDIHVEGIGGKKVLKGKENWKINLKRRNRAAGKDYIGRVYNAEGKYSEVEKGKREMGDRCSCTPVGNMCRNFTDNDRELIFQSVWGMSWQEKAVFVDSMTDRVMCKRRKTEKDVVKKTATFKYHLKLNGERKKVGFKFFLSTTGLKETWVRDQISPDKQSDPSALSGNEDDDRRKRKSVPNDRKAQLQQFLSSLPKVPSHYCRKSSNKLYLEPLFNSMSAVYQLYKASCPNPLSHFTFEEFHLMNLSVFKPRKDQCDLCVAYKEGNIDDIKYEDHRKRKERAQEEKQLDKEKASRIGSKTMVITLDMQSVLLCPMLKASALYYRTKLCVHNYTVFNVATKDVCCYVWNESEGGLSANEYASCLIDYLCGFVNDYDEFVIFSDGCTAQNRNVTLSSALCYFAMKHKKIVCQKILEKGHTQMEVDSVHSCIERQLLNKTIQIPGDYVSHIESARKAKPYRVKHIEHDFFQNYSNVINLSSIRPGRNVGDPVVTDLRCLLYTPQGRIQYKINYDDFWLDLPLRRSDSISIANEPHQLHQSRLKIAESKFKHLQELKSVIHADYHSYYDSLPH